MIFNTNTPPFKTRQQNGKTEIWDNLRKRWIYLTPEEWVRQNFIHHIIEVKKYPPTLIAIEREIKLYELRKRFDIVVYDRSTKPWMIVECKNENEVLSEKTLEQALRYNLVIQALYLVVTNGANTITFYQHNKNIERIHALPDFLVA